MATRTIANSPTTWSSSGSWVEGVVPTASDDVVATSTSGNLTISAAAACRSAVFTNYTGTLTHNTGITWTFGTSSNPPGNVMLTFVPGMTYTIADATSALSFATTAGTVTHVFTSAGKTLGNISAGGGIGAVYRQQDAVTCANVTASRGYNTNGNTLNCTSFTSTGGTRTISFGSSIINVSGTGTCWSMATTSLTMSANTSTINLTDTSSTAKTFAGGGVTYNNLTIAGGGSGSVTVTGANTFATVSATGPKTIIWPASTTNTMTGLAALGTAGNLVTMTSSTGGTAATLSKASGAVTGVDYVSLQDIAATGGATWYAGANSTNVSGNSGWSFTAATQEYWGAVA